MMAKNYFGFLSDLFPYEKKSALDWIVPASIGLGLGVAAGVSLGMLLAPTSGDITRRKLVDGAGRIKERAVDAAQRAKGQIAQVKGQITHSSDQSFNQNLGDRSFVNDVVGGVR
jgi:hypothetical protein